MHASEFKHTSDVADIHIVCFYVYGVRVGAITDYLLRL